jgi:membrane fusion protein (multidrug efflux system)
MSSPLRVEKQPGEAAEPAPAKSNGASRRRIVVLGILVLLALAGVVAGWRTVRFYAHHATTDDAQIEGHIDPVLSRVSGYVAEVQVEDNQAVQAGDLLLRVDPADLQAKVDQEAADLANAEAAVAVARAAAAAASSSSAGMKSSSRSAESNIAAARARAEQASGDLARYAELVAKEEISQQQYDAARSAADAAKAALEAARSQADSVRSGSSAAGSQVDAARQQIAAAQAKVAQHRAALAAAKLQLSYAVVRAPTAGTVAKKNVEVGQYVQAGQPLLAVVQGHDVWVIANFKETQLDGMRPGQTATIEVDAYSKGTFHGRVESLSAATGAKFSLLPPDNATGNFTKVVQRVPVKIVLTDPPDSKRPLRVGMNVSIVVNLD